MKRRLFLSGVAVTVFELGVDALMLFLFFGLTRKEGLAAVVALGPALLVSTLYWLLLSSRWQRGMDGELGEEAAREAVVRFPRRSLLYRSIATAGLALLITPTLAVAFSVDLNQSAVIAGTISMISFATSMLRAFLYRWVLKERGELLFAKEPLRLAARCLRERLFVSTNLPGCVGVLVAGAYLHEIVGVPVSSFSEAVALAPPLVTVLIAICAYAMMRVTSPLMPFLVPQRHPQGPTPPGQVLALASSASYQLAAVGFVTWVTAAVLCAARQWALGAVPGAALQVFGGVTAVGLGAVMYQVHWQRRILLPVREAAAQSLVAEEEAPHRSRLSLRAKLLAAFGVVLVFGGTFAFLTALAEHDRFIAATSSAEAEAARDTLLRQQRERLLEASRQPGFAATLGAIAADGTQAFLLRDGRLLLPDGLSLPQGLEAQLTARESGSLSLQSRRLSVAWIRVSPDAVLGVAKPWRTREHSDSLKTILFVFAALGAASVGLVLLAVQDVTRPIRQLARQAKQLGRGHLGDPITAPDADEMAELASALEYARRELQQKIRSVEELNASLEQKVTARTAELEVKNRELSRTLAELGEVKDQVVLQEKMASLGRLVAGIAHEINNPLNFVQNGLPPLKNTIDLLRQVSDALPASDAAPAELSQSALAASRLKETLGVARELEDANDMLRVMNNGVARMGSIVRALRDFSRQSHDNAPEPVDLEWLLDDAAALLGHELRGRVEILKELEARGPIVVEPGPLTQVFVNLLKNAAQAIDGPGTVTLRSRKVEGGLELKIIDSGRGMPPDVLSKIFEPFFTTKPVGQGTGLGLAIVHGIVSKHGGRIAVSSEVGRGTEFTLFLPAAA